MKTDIRYIEHKPREHTDRAEAWIAKVWLSKSGKTLYFNDKALKQVGGLDSTHYDLMTGEDYWVSGVKKSGSNRHTAVGGGGPIFIEEGLVEWYHEYVDSMDFYEIIPLPDFSKPDISKFSEVENAKFD